MKLIRRKQSPTVHERALGYVKLAARALALVRVARTTHKGYKRARRLPMLLVGGALVAFVLKKLRGSGGAEQPAQTWQPTPATTTPSTSPPAAPSTAPPASAGTNGAPNPELAPEGGDIAPDLEASEKPSSPS